MPIRDWPKSERPRERLIARGPEALSDAELLAVIIGSGLRGRSALDVARQLIAAFGSIRGLLQADSRECLRTPGLGPARFALLRAGVELARRHHLDVLQARPVVPSERPLREFLLAQLRDRPYEVFCCLHLDSRHRLITFEELFRGTVDGAAVHPRELVRQAVAHNSTAVILVHNHPSGVAEPSHADELITRRVRDSLALIDVRVLDHIIVGDGTCVSFAERGLL
ncbi:MAG TPA: DNA repair protein RadC [Steroidobacteraceae bacterium]|nr:DNA repair protein RadC [Steroidobacteraceae bacterium]